MELGNIKYTCTRQFGRKEKPFEQLDRSHFSCELEPIDLARVQGSLEIHISNFSGFPGQSASPAAARLEVRKREAAAPRYCGKVPEGDQRQRAVERRNDSPYFL